MEHVSEDGFELYAMRSLPAPESDRMEEHLLVCSACRDRLDSTHEERSKSEANVPPVHAILRHSNTP